MEKKTYTVNEIATLLGVGRHTAYNLVNRADFPKIVVGRRYVIPIQAFDNWLEKTACGGVDFE